jgi:hypothetical protein
MGRNGSGGGGSTTSPGGSTSSPDYPSMLFPSGLLDGDGGPAPAPAPAPVSALAPPSRLSRSPVTDSGTMGEGGWGVRAVELGAASPIRVGFAPMSGGGGGGGSGGGGGGLHGSPIGGGSSPLSDGGGGGSTLRTVRHVVGAW